MFKYSYQLQRSFGSDVEMVFIGVVAVLAVMTADGDGIGVGDVAVTAVLAELELGRDSLDNWDGIEVDDS